MASLSLFVLYVLILSLALPSLSIQFGQKFSGDGTYYGTTEGGHCSLRLPRPAMYSAWQPIALNTKQYADSLPCGACIEYQGSGRGSGANPIKGKRIGYIMDSCPSCEYGDIDLSKSGDGRWDVEWKFIPCPGSSFPVDFLLEGSNQWYKKIQPRGTRTPVKTFTINGVQGKRTIDNFFIFNAQFGNGVTAVMKTVQGETVTVKIPYWVSDGVIAGGVGQSAGRGSARPPSQPQKPAPQRRRPSPPRPSRRSPPRRPSNGRCVPRWRTCSGKRAFKMWRTTNCCGGWRCAWPKKRRGFGGRRCQPPRRQGRKGGNGKCVPNWKACTGRKNVWGTSKCCGNYRCVVAKQRTFVGKRCEPK